MQRNQKSSSILINGSKLKIAIVVSKFNDDITGGMLYGAAEVLKKNGVSEKNISTVWVPGAIEIPLACQRLAETKKYHGIIALGCVIKGDTDHYKYVSGESIRGVMDVMLKTGIPIGMGIITTNNLKQAKDRSGATNNKGAESAQAVLEMI
ncbi:MAG: 6,7-dimethyl-8-ribityllumazine synthase [Candidatus Moranbacteria bacterium]|nr:6,7-dimethyl-8-ribityllumazine synthase [Candidatus Moranbacteria bacterium]